ncbi:MAG TPA: hypothetical protein VF261_00505 [Candidatus Saccharimonadales bacterium]
MEPATRYALLSQIILYVALVVCISIRPAGLGTDHGISYYGVYANTVFFYTLGLLGAAYFTLRVISHLQGQAFKLLRLALHIYVPLVVGIVITPYAAGALMDHLHDACGTALFSLQLALSGWFIWQLRHVWWSIVLTSVEFIGGVLSAFYLGSTQGLLLQCQVLFQLAFGALLVLSLQRLALSAGLPSKSKQPRADESHTP